MFHTSDGLLKSQGQPGITLSQGLQLGFPLLHVGSAKRKNKHKYWILDAIW